MTEKDWRDKLHKDDEVYWTDPDDDICSGYYLVQEILEDVLVLSNQSGSIVEVFKHEVS